MDKKSEQYLKTLSKHLEDMLEEGARRTGCSGRGEIPNELAITLMTACYLAGVQQREGEKENVKIKIK